VVFHDPLEVTMRKRLMALGVAMVLGTAGCAEYGGYRPAVDTYNDPNAQNVSRDEAECRDLARRASGGSAQQTVTGGIVGGLVGAAAGAAIGAAAGGNAGKGAAIGAATGGVGGGAYKGIEADANYKSAYRDCMRNRGHNVLN
jgi:outer membrane lipoprotein SlyB